MPDINSIPADMAFARSIKNISSEGDTDVLPFPIENLLMYDQPNEVKSLLAGIHADFDRQLSQNPPFFEKLLVPSGYNGFRWVMQIDPVWNAYLLALCIQIAPEIENRRPLLEDKSVFSYRFQWDADTGRLFSQDAGYSAFQLRATELAKQHKYVVLCDISNFYDSIYHHKLENALRRVTNNTEAVRRINLILFKLADGASYGVPVGGNAARMLAEALLIRVDRLLATEGISYCRFVDDFRLFANSQDEAFERLLFLNQSLGDTELLRLQRSKSAIVSGSEYLKSEGMVLHGTQVAIPDPETREFLQLRLYFDPYSSTAEHDYEELKQELSRFNIVGMLARELSKSRVQISVTKRLVSALRYMDNDNRMRGIETILSNLDRMYPVFPHVAITLRRLMEDIGAKEFATFGKVWREVCQTKAYVKAMPSNLAYAVKVLCVDPSSDAEKLLAGLFKESSSPIVRRDIIYSMTSRGADHWIATARASYGGASLWEKRAIYLASDLLGDEGVHWRKNVATNADAMSKLLLSWTRAQKQARKDWVFPA